MIYFNFPVLFQFSCFISIFLFYFNFHVLFQFSCLSSIVLFVFNFLDILSQQRMAEMKKRSEEEKQREMAFFVS